MQNADFKPSASAVPNQPSADHIPCILLPVNHNTLLLPGVSIAEIVHYSPPLPVPDAPTWLLGNAQWRTQTVPLLSFEVLTGQPAPPITSASHIAVLNNTGINSERLPFLAMLIQGMPRQLRILPADISEIETPSPSPVTVMAVTVAGMDALIPDVGAMEKMLCNYPNNLKASAPLSPPGEPDY